MPIYEFSCESCDHCFEELVRSSSGQDEDVSCPECDSRKVKRLLSSFSFKSAGNPGAAAAAGSACGPCTKSSCKGCG